MYIIYLLYLFKNPINNDNIWKNDNKINNII